MKRYMTVGVSMLAGAALGGAATETIRAQVKPPAYVIAEITVKDQDGYFKEFGPARVKAIAEGGGKYLVRSDKTISIHGAAPAPRIVVVQFENLDKLRTWTQTSGFKDSQDIGDKYADIRIYAVEGVAP
jgi:uncharacterized protein (DUF1330 family)